MPIYNLMGGQEVSHKTSENYKEKVIEFMDLDGYILVRNSSRVAMTTDLIFKKPIVEGDTEIIVETKYADVSLSNPDFLTEIARYFILYMNKKETFFDFYIFIRKCRNWNKWKYIFSSTLFKLDYALKFYHDMVNKNKLNIDEKLGLNKYQYLDFEKFLSDTYIYQINYDGLLMKIEDLKKINYKNTGFDFYLRELEPLKSRDILTSNVSEIIEFPEDVYKYVIRDGIEFMDIYNNEPYYIPFWIKERNLYSMFVLDETYQKYVSNENYERMNFVDWYLKNKDNRLMAQTLLKKLLLNVGVINGCKYIKYKGDNLYFIHDNFQNEIKKVKGKQVTRLFKDTKSPFIKHEAIKINVKFYSEKCYVIFTPIVLFSDDKNQLIKGKDVNKLHLIFSPNKYDNNKSIFGDLKWWASFLLDETESHGIITSNLIDFELMVRPPKNSKERNRQVFTDHLRRFMGV